ncbi:MAG: hypothetical protein SFU56_11000 [Capsulimonadales bacterium]|nr:hypothetical protein [Capsulimonadales bacterium]
MRRNDIGKSAPPEATMRRTVNGTVFSLRPSSIRFFGNILERTKGENH